jgi:hypothetical protein
MRASLSLWKFWRQLEDIILEIGFFLLLGHTLGDASQMNYQLFAPLLYYLYVLITSKKVKEENILVLIANKRGQRTFLNA